ncbi:putative holin-like toxin [Oceanobacillus jeddahense]
MVGSFPIERGWCCITVFESLMLAIAFASLIIAVLSFNHKK